MKTTRAREEFYDASFCIRGISFGLRVYRTGYKQYFARFRNKAGQDCYISLGDANLITLADARKGAIEKKAIVDQGGDPAKDKRELRAAETVWELFEQYHERYATQRQRPSTYRERERLAKVEIKPTIGAMKAREVTRKHIINLIEHMEVDRKAPVQAGNLRGLLFSIFRYGMERDIVPTNPCVCLPRLQSKKAKETFLSEDHIKNLWSELDSLAHPFGPLFKMILLTAARPGEVSGMRWSEIHGDEWTIPTERNKSKRPHVVPLSKLAQELLREVRRKNDEIRARVAALRCRKRKPTDDLSYYDEFVFPTRYKTAVSWWNNTFRRLVTELAKLGKIIYCTPHDLRRSAATHMRRIGIGRDVVSAILNHQPRGVTSVYDRYDMLHEKKLALGKWSREVERILSSNLTKVVELKSE